MLFRSYHSEDFEAALITAVNLGDDADTVGAVTGQIAGAAWGEASIPSRWLNSLVWRNQIVDMANGLGRLASCTSGDEHAI